MDSPRQALSEGSAMESYLRFKEGPGSFPSRALGSARFAHSGCHSRVWGADVACAEGGRPSHKGLTPHLLLF